MEQEQEIAKFYNDICQEVINKSSVEDEEAQRVDTFTQIYIENLCEAGELTDGIAIFYKDRQKGIRCNGFSLSEDYSELILFVSEYRNNRSQFNLAPGDAKDILNRGRKFYKECVNGLYTKIEEARDIFDLCKSIYDYKNTISFVKIVLFTNANVRSVPLEDEELEGVNITCSIWDIERLYRVCSSGSSREKISIDLKELTGKTLECIKVDIPAAVGVKRVGIKREEYKTSAYTSYFTVFPGDVLFKIYQAYNSRLLEKNVRTFLQARGGVNQGIRDTINDLPQMFLAYNNGISATAEAVIVENERGNSCTITAIKDFQIVNGGQTTASIFNTCKKNRTPLSKVYVQAKITVLQDQDDIETIVSNISRYANTQNKIQNADFSANDVFHQEMERLSRNMWAPSKSGGEKQTRWFYERARGQYNDIKNRNNSSKAFESMYPKEQYFDKLDLARCENVWEQLPYIAAKGGQKSFAEFTLRLAKRGNFVPDEEYFKSLIAKLILYRCIRKIVKDQRFQGFWANIVDYTFSYLSMITNQQIDLTSIWKNQDVSDDIKKVIPNIAVAVYNCIIGSANGQNITQWCKKKECWEFVKKINIGDDAVGIVKEPSRPTAVVKDSNESVEFIKSLDVGLLEELRTWGKETKALQGVHCIILSQLIKDAKNNWRNNPKGGQSNMAVEIIKIAIQKGFISDQEIIDKVEVL